MIGCIGKPDISKDQGDFVAVLNTVIPPRTTLPGRRALRDMAVALRAEYGYSPDVVVYSLLCVLRLPACRQTPVYLRGVIRERHRRTAHYLGLPATREGDE